jgi:hypothetical protein
LCKIFFCARIILVKLNFNTFLINMSSQNPQNYKNDDAINSFDPKQIANILDVEKKILAKETAIATTESFIAKRTGFMSKIVMVVGFLTILSISLTGALISQNIDNKNSQAAITYGCLSTETLSGINCISDSSSYPVYGEGCETGYITMQSVCAKVVQLTCANFEEAVNAENGFCKIGDTNNVLLSEVTDVDGRTCNGNGYNFKRYNVGFATNSTEGPVVCASAFSGVFGKANFRFVPQVVTDIQNFSTSQTGSKTIPCLAGYTTINNNTQCSRPATIVGCSAGGEYLGGLNLFGNINASAETITNTQTTNTNGNNISTTDTNLTIAVSNSSSKSSSISANILSSSSIMSSSILSSSSLVVSSSNSTAYVAPTVSNSLPPITPNLTCKQCPAGQYCPNNSTGSTTVKLCINGGSLSGDKCIAPNKISQTTYSDGCSSEYVKLDQSCAIIEVRTHDLGCTYYYASDNVNVLSTLSEDGVRCSTGGRTDFETTSIVKVSDLQCDGPDSAYYNYNVAYDPLVCGKGNPTNKAAFRWSQNSFTKITGLQKLGKNTSVCPATWTSLNDTECYQLVSTQEYKAKNDCPVNTYCPEGSTVPTPCPVNTTSPAKSTKLSDCVGPKVCASGQTLYNNNCFLCSSPLYLINGVCGTVCQAGYERNLEIQVFEGNIVCKPVVNNGGVIIISTGVSSAASSQIAQVVVCVSKPGEYFTNGSCVPCIAGYYCPGGNNAPIICPIAYYCPPASASPTPCPIGTTTVGLGSRILDDCKATAKPAVTVVRTGGLQVFIVIFSTLSFAFFGYIYVGSKNAKGGLNNGWSKVK